VQDVLIMMSMGFDKLSPNGMLDWIAEKRRV
jgi:hypothetical protein